jgi:RNA polymerase sigma factor (sigma-70 family)
MDERDAMAQRFQAQRELLRTVAYRMLGSLSEADDAVQEAWLRLSRVDTSQVDNLAGWLRTVVTRICLDMLRSRRSRQDLAEQQVLDQAFDGVHSSNPEDEALLADSVSRALLVVLNTLQPAERIAFVLHDMFAVPFHEIAPIIERTPVATKKLGSRARRKVQGTPGVPAAELARTARWFPHS